MENFKTYTEFNELNEKVKGWNDVAKIMDKALKSADVPLSYAKDYVKSLERMAKKNSKKFFAEYGDFSTDDFIEDVEYNMANENKVNESVIGIKTERDFKGKDLITALDKAKIKYKMNRLSMTLSVLDLDKKYYDDAKKVVDDLGLTVMMAKESEVNEAYTDEERMVLADKGFALSDGSFPIKDLKDLKNAIQAYGRAKDQARAAKFIVKRAKALGAEDLIPDTEDFQKSLGESVVNEGPDYSEAKYQMDKIFGDDQESIEKFQDIEDNGTVEDMIDYINNWGDEDRLADYGIKSDAHVKKFAKKIMENAVTEAKALVSKKDIKDIEDSGNIDIAYKKAMALLKSLSESVAVGSAIHDVSTQIPAKTIAIEEGKDIGEWNQGGLKGNKNVLVTTFVGPPAVEEFGLGRKCMQINVGMNYVALNPADIVELKDLLKSYKVK